MKALLVFFFIQFYGQVSFASSCERMDSRHEECLEQSELNVCQRELIRDYTTFGALHINKALRGQEQDPLCEQMAKKLEVALEDLPEVVTTVYRGSGHLKEYRTLQTGECVRDLGFLSTSTDRDTAKWFAKKQMLLTISTSSGRDISPLSRFPEGSEILLKPGTWLRLKETPTLNNGLLEYELEEAPETECSRKVTISPNQTPEKAAQ